MSMVKQSVEKVTAANIYGGVNNCSISILI